MYCTMLGHRILKTALTSTARRQQSLFSKTAAPYNSSGGITRLGTEVLPTMSQAVMHNDIVYLSGQVDGTGEDVVAQTKNVLAKVDAYLEEAGTDKSKLLTSTIWLKNIERDFGAMNEVWCQWIDDNNKPVRATTEASLAAPNMLVEIQVTAAK
ncbi:RutC family protein [Skeletonema marinoi]|uniref:RutC family protein n=1 Tax=Skeletonema marinoi TaxID=267567 RepID=A0AAD8XZ05_9STRA|nr:RutC family protein [Skeletonema marinoi]KAK1737059.1 RutC family protein [Skeletonema marinoi]